MIAWIRAGWTAMSVVLVLHLLAGLGLVGWLWRTDRLSRDRLVEAVELFKPTLAEQERLEEQAEAERVEAGAEASREAWLRRVAVGPETVEDRLASQADRDSMEVAVNDRLQREIADLRAQLQRQQRLLAQQRQELAAERQTFRDAVEREQAKRADADFQQAVKTLEGLDAEQAKQMLQQLIASGEESQAVDYLAAMQERRAAAVLREFESAREIEQVTRLIEQLRTRGARLAPDLDVATSSG